MSDTQELKGTFGKSSPWTINVTAAVGHYDEGFDSQPMTPPVIHFKELPKLKKSKYKSLLGEQLEIPEQNETDLNPGEQNISLVLIPSTVSSYSSQEKNNTESQLGTISGEVMKKGLSVTSVNDLEAPHKHSETSPSSETILKMFEKSSVEAQQLMKTKTFRKCSSVSDLKSDHVFSLASEETPHYHTADCQLSNSRSNSVTTHKRSSSTTDLITKRPAEYLQTTAYDTVIKTRLSASAEAVRKQTLGQDRSRQSSGESVSSGSPKLKPKLLDSSFMGKFIHWSTTSPVKVKNSDVNVWTPTSF